MRKGFTLVEIMIVVAIIALLAAIAIPNLLRARLNANESAALAAMQTLVGAATSYRGVNPAFPADLVALSAGTTPYIDLVLGSGAKQGYNYVLNGTGNTFTATARPQAYEVTGTRSFYCDQSGVIRYTSADAEAGPTDATIE
jgi:prepilin-type N-terminal cleavage/methylation domain-containing protein